MSAGDRYPETSAEHAEEARRLLRIAESDITEAVLSADPGLIASATSSYAGKIATAQVHATLATILDPLERQFGGERIDGTLSATISLHSRVVFIQERPGRKHRILASELIGTVIEVTEAPHPELTTARVEWDDGQIHLHNVIELAVVLGA